MKKTIVITFIIGIVSTVSAQIDTVSLKNFGLKGKISSITDYSYLLKENNKGTYIIGKDKFILIPLEEEWKISENSDLNQKTNVTYDFDKTGRNVRITYYFTPGKPNDVTEFKYDNSGKITGSENTLYYSDGKFNLENIFIYDASGKLVQSRRQENDRVIQEATYKYNNDGHLIEKVVVAKGEIAEKDIRDYERNNMIFENIIIPNKEKKSTYRYNTDNQVVFSRVEYPEHGIFHETIYEYKDGLLSKAIHNNDLGQETICTYEYASGKLVKEKCFDAKDSDGFSIEKENRYLQNAKSIFTRAKEVILEEKEYKKGLLNKHKTETYNYSYQYKYDSKGNWIEIIQYENNIPLKRRVREISYY